MTETARPHLFIATPMYGGMCTGAYARSMILLCTDLTGVGIDWNLSFTYNESLITRGRNFLVQGFLEAEAATHLMFIDADIRFSTDDVLRMLGADVDILCGVYPKKAVDWDAIRHAALRGVSAADLPWHTGLGVGSGIVHDAAEDSEPVEVQFAGTGFMLIKRGVFEALANNVSTYRNDGCQTIETMGLDRAGREFWDDRLIRQYFDTSIENDHLLSEDYNFCRLARENGIKVHAAPWVKLAHIGTYTFGQPALVPDVFADEKYIRPLMERWGGHAPQADAAGVPTRETTGP